MNAASRAFVHHRAEYRCEYCRLPQDALPFTPFHVEHIIPKKHDGNDRPSNLALACHHCNLYKGTNLTGIDATTDQITALFNPRTDTWHQHFRVHQVTISGRTDTGRTTARVLNMNTLPRLRLRSKIKTLGLSWP